MGGMFFSIKSKDNQINQQVIENFKLNEKLQSMATVTGNKIQIVYRDKDVIHYVNTYIPPEGNHTTITTDNNGQVNIKYDKYGVGLFPFLGVGYTGEIVPLVGARLVYFDRYGIGLSASDKSLNMFMDIRTDWSLFQNSSFGIFYNTKKDFGISAHTFF
jgi:hypothetical protein